MGDSVKNTNTHEGCPKLRNPKNLTKTNPTTYNKRSALQSGMDSNAVFVTILLPLICKSRTRLFTQSIEVYRSFTVYNDSVITIVTNQMYNCVFNISMDSYRVTASYLLQAITQLALKIKNHINNEHKINKFGYIIQTKSLQRVCKNMELNSTRLIVFLN